ETAVGFGGFGGQDHPSGGSGGRQPRRKLHAPCRWYGFGAAPRDARRVGAGLRPRDARRAGPRRDIGYNAATQQILDESNTSMAQQRPLAAFRSRDFSLLWIGNLVSLTGTEMTRAAISWQIYTLTGSELALGMI